MIIKEYILEKIGVPDKVVKGYHNHFTGY